jgi:N-acylglucosamine-6-phosphate 2-epimerase
MDIQTFKQQVINKIVVSIQPVTGSPLDTTDIIVAMAKAAENSGAPALRIEGIQNVAAVCRAVTIPVIGIVKRDASDHPIRITCLLEDVEALAQAGATVIAFDPTNRTRPVPRLAILQAIKKTGCLAMADCSRLEDGLWAHEYGAEIIGTTLSGYVDTEADSIPVEPDFELVQVFAAKHFFVMAEGRYNTPDMAAQAIRLGATAVTIGSAITRLEIVTDWFLQATQKAAMR